MAELSLNQVAQGLFLLLVIVSMVMLIMYVSALGEEQESWTCKYLDLCGDTEQLEELQDFRKDPTSFTNFTKSYIDCKQSADIGCACDIPEPKLPVSTFIHITNQNLFSSIAVCEGQVYHAEDYECDEFLAEEDIHLDKVLVPKTSSGNLFDESGLKENLFAQAESIIITKEETKTKIHLDQEIFGRNKIDYGWVYKKDETEMVFMPGERKVETCRAISGADEAIEAFNTFTDAFKGCSTRVLPGTEEKRVGIPLLVLLKQGYVHTGVAVLDERERDPTWDFDTYAAITYVMEADGFGAWEVESLHIADLTNSGHRLREKSIPVEGYTGSDFLEPQRRYSEERHGQKFGYLQSDIEYKKGALMSGLSGKNIEEGLIFLGGKEKLEVDSSTLSSFMDLTGRKTLASMQALQGNVRSVPNGVCGYADFQLPSGFTINFGDKKFKLYQGETQLGAKLNVPVQLFQGTTPVTEFAVDFTDVAVEFTKIDAGVQVKLYDITTVAQAKRTQAEEAIGELFE